MALHEVSRGTVPRCPQQSLLMWPLAWQKDAAGEGPVEVIPDSPGGLMRPQGPEAAEGSRKRSREWAAQKGCSWP